MEATDLYALVPRERLDHLRGALATQGVYGDEVVVHAPEPGRYLLHDEVLHQDASAARRGLVAGAAIGAVVGLVVGLLLPQVDGAGLVFAAMVALAGFGGLIGAMTGLQRVEHMDNDPLAYREVLATDPMVMVEVHHEHWHNRAHRIMERHGAVFLQEPHPIGPSEDHSSSAPSG